MAVLRWLARFEGSRLAVAGLVLAAVLFVAVNVLANATLRGVQLDLTENRLFTLAEGTRATLRAIDEPVDLRLYLSPSLGEAAPRYRAYGERVRELLHRYAELANGRVRLTVLDPEPFSDAEDRAVADGLQGVPVNAGGELAYFGLAGSNTTDGRAVIPFFNLEREPFLEYDLTKLVHALARPRLPVLGVLSSLPLDGEPSSPAGAGPRPLLLEQIREFFTVEDLDPTLDAIPDTVGVLLVIDPVHLDEDAVRAVDRFVHAGGPALVIVDPVIESAPPLPPRGPAGAADAAAALLRAWGLILVADKVAGDLDAARRVSAGPRSATVGDYVAWLTLGAPSFDTGDPVMANIERLNLATAGILEKAPEATTTITPLIQTGPRAMAIDANRVRFMPDIRALQREFRADGTPIMLAARVSGAAARAFPEDAGGDEAAPADQRRPINVIVLADADMIFDRFWVTANDFFGQQLIVPLANNADLIINALENLSGSQALIGLRGRGTSYRPFDLIDSFRRDAEVRYRAKEQQLQARLRDLQDQLRDVQRAEAGSGEIILTAEQKAAIDRFRAEMLTVRRDLRDVQRALRQDIERIEGWVKVANIAAVPVLLGIGIAGVVGVRRLRRRPAAGGAAKR